MKPRLLIKLGGSSLQNSETVSQLVSLVQQSLDQGYLVAVVHGGGPAINEELVKRGIQWQFINGQRQTTPEMMKVVDEVLSQTVNRAIVDQLQNSQVPAIGISAAEEKILFCSQASEELLQVGKVESVNPESILKIWKSTLKVPVIAPIGVDENGTKYNVNADWAAAKIAIQLKANKLIFLTDQKGILDKEKKLVSQIDPQGIDLMVTEGTIVGGMYTKVQAMMAALSQGVGQVKVLHAGQASEALTNKAVGTTLSNQNIKFDLQRGNS